MQGRGVTVWFGFQFSHLLDGKARKAMRHSLDLHNGEKDLGLVYVLTLLFHAYDTMSPSCVHALWLDG